MSNSSSSPLIIGGVRNSLIGGDFSTNPWQRGTSNFTITGTGQYTADRWKAARGSSASGQTIKYTTLTLGDVPGTKHALRSQRDSGNSSTAICVVAQSILSLDSLALNNRLITLSFWARAGNDFTGTLAAQIYFGQGTDQNVISGFTTATSVTKVCGITPTWQKFTLTTFAGNFTQAAAYFAHNPTGTASTNDWFEIALVQLAPSLPGEPFLFRSVAEEVALCQQFHVKIKSWRSYAYAANSTKYVCDLAFPIAMRSAPSVTISGCLNMATAGSITISSVVADERAITEMSESGANSATYIGFYYVADDEL